MLDHQTQYDDDRDDLAALDFSAHDDSTYESDADAFGDYTGEPAEEAEPGLDAIDPFADDTDDEEQDPLQQYTFTVTNPPESVSVSALIGGRIHQVEVLPKAMGMTEAELADEILVLAHLASQKALAGQTTYLLESEVLANGMREAGLDSGEVVRDFMQNGLGFPTPEAVDAEQAEIFATRYTGDDD
jgi:hypothetical protein